MPSTYELAVIGMGPAGIGVAAALQNSPIFLNTICFERGEEVNAKKCIAIYKYPCCNSNTCHIISGIGGASSLSNGKLSLFPAGSGLKRFFATEQELESLMADVIQSLEIDAGLKKVEIDKKVISDAKKFYLANDITYKYYDVYEFDGDKYRNYLASTIQSLTSHGLQLHAKADVISIERDDSNLWYTITVAENGVINFYKAKRIVLAVGSSQINNYLVSALSGTKAINYEIGLRVELKSECFGDHLDAHGDLKLISKSGRTYCVTRGGAIVSYRTDGYSLLEGYVDKNQLTDYSNLAVLVKADDEEELNKFFGNYYAFFGGVPVRQKYIDYQLGNVSTGFVHTTLAKSQIGDINKMFPNSINEALREFIDHVIVKTMHIEKEAITIVAPELKTVVNFELTDHFEITSHLYVVGAATGKFRGILQSICSGVQCGKYILGE